MLAVPVILLALAQGAYANPIPPVIKDTLHSRAYNNNPPVGDYPDEENFDLSVMLFSLGTMLLMYLLVCFIYVVIRFILNRLVSRSDRLNSNMGRNGGSRLSLTRDEREADRNRRIIESMSVRWPTTLDDETEVRGKVAQLSAEEQFYYHQGEEYIRSNPPILVPNQPSYAETAAGIVDPIINEQTRQFIEEEGASGWEFEPDVNLPNDTILIENKTEVTFLNYNYDASVTTNLPIPCLNRVYYCEFKIFEVNTPNGKITNSLNNPNINVGSSQQHGNDDTIPETGTSASLAAQNETIVGPSQDDDRSIESSLDSMELNNGTTKSQGNELISFGLSTSPYPYFRLPGRHHHSLAYDSTGSRRFNDSFDLEPQFQHLFPSFQKGDVIGIGYRARSGTVFFTRNGKKLSEKSVGGHVRGWKFKYLYPIIGANIPCRIHANFGTYGFVYIEANVKKWGYGKINGMKLPPPSYDNYGQDTLLESGAEDEDEDDENNISDELSLDDDETGHSRSVDENEGLRDQTGKLLPPPPGFEFSTSPETTRIGEEISLGPLPMEPPNYSDNESSYSYKWQSHNSASSNRPIAGSSKVHTGLSSAMSNFPRQNSPDDKDDYDDEYDYDEYDLHDDEDEEADTDEYEEDIGNELQRMISHE